MRALFINRVYPPQPGATGQVLADLAGGLSKLGWDVNIVTSAARESTASPDVTGAVNIFRVTGIPFTRSSTWRRALSYLSLYPALFLRAGTIRRPDVVVTMTDPPLQLLLGSLLKFTKRCRLVHWAQDLYPELAEELEVIRKDGPMAKFLRALSTFALRRHDVVVAIGECMKERLLQRGVDERRIVVIPNWSLAGILNASEPEVAAYREKLGWQGRFVVMYSGNFGLAHPFESVVDAARRLNLQDSPVLFVFVGEGPRLESLKSELVGLPNVQWLPPQALENLGRSMQAADVHLASMNERTCGLVVPSKVYGIIAAGRPCIFLGPPASEVARLISENQCGHVLPSTDGAALANLLSTWAADPVRVTAMRRQAKALGRRVSIESAVERFDVAMRESGS